MKVLITGGAGFIGSNFVLHMLEEHPGYNIVVVDKLTYAGNLGNLAAVLDGSRLQFVRMDICDPAIADVVQGCDAVVHFAAESHVDRSIEDASAFIRTNIEGTWRMVEACRVARVARYLQVSTDEVYGSLGPEGQFTESSPLAANSPYAATKAAADLIVRAAVQTYGFPAIITRCSNNYGPRQFPEKFIPLMIARAMSGQPLPIYGDGRNARDWIHVEDHCRALDLILHRGTDSEVYNVGGECELRNIEVAYRILDVLGKPRTLIQFVADRPGHDRRYALDCRKLKTALGWKQCRNFTEGLASTIQWYQNNGPWLEGVGSQTYRDYCDRHYLHRDLLLAGIKSA
jgi:dTDP-glucose 4,6-dehydratase